MATTLKDTTSSGSQLTPETRMAFSGVLWETYLVMREDPGLYRVRMAFRKGELELMSPSYPHERLSRLVARFVEAAATELGIDLLTSASVTLKAPNAENALEADESYYIANESAVRANEVIDLDCDPPPDLAIEAEISRTVVDRLPIYAELGVPEVWRVRPDGVVMLKLTAEKQYAVISASRSFPLITPQVVFEFLERRREMSENKLVEKFRQWIRDQAAEK